MRSFLIFGVIVSLAVAAFGLECFVCNSKESSACGDPFDPSAAIKANLLKDCSTLPRQYQRDPISGRNRTVPYTFCRKTTQKAALIGIKEEDRRIVRSCGYLNETRLETGEDEDKSALRCYQRTGTFDVHVLYCACHGDKCNPATRMQVPFGILLGTMIFAKIIM